MICRPAVIAMYTRWTFRLPPTSDTAQVGLDWNDFICMLRPGGGYALCMGRAFRHDLV